MDVASGVLTVKGHKEEDKVEKKQDFHLRERRFGSFARSVPHSRNGRRRQDRGQLQEWRAEVDAAEETRGPEADQEDRGEGRLTPPFLDDRRPRSVFRASGLCLLMGRRPRSPDGGSGRYSTSRDSGPEPRRPTRRRPPR